MDRMENTKKNEGNKNCLTLYKIISGIVKKGEKKNNGWFKTIIFLSLFLLIFTVFLIDYFKNANSFITKTNIYYPLLVLFINLFLSFTIIIYIFISRSVDRRIEGLINAFNNKEYDSICQTIFTWLDIKFRKSSENKNSSRIRIVSKILFSLIWIAGIGFISCYSIINTCLCDSYSGYIVVVLFIVSSLMQGYSFFYSFVYIRFLHKLSQNSNRDSLEKYEYNFFLPAQSSGYKQLMSNINFNSTCFIIESLLFVATFIVLTFLSNTQHVDILTDFSDLVFYSIYILLCVVGSLVIYLVPKYMMKRVLTVWVDKSRRILEKRIKKEVEIILNKESIEDNKKSEEIIYTTENNIANLQKESYVFNGDYINLVLVAVTLLVTALPIVLQIFRI